MLLFLRAISGQPSHAVPALLQKQKQLLIALYEEPP
jgi:hypothetical protein